MPGQTAAPSHFVSVIVPVKNVARFLPRALASVRAQTHHPLELIVVDGGSTDDSPAVAQAFAPDQWVIQTRPGLWAAFNQGLALAQGEYLAFLGGDDYWPANCLAGQVDFARTHPHLACVFGRTQFYLEPEVSLPPGVRSAMLNGPRPIRLLECMLARRSAFDKLGGFSERYRLAADTDWFARAGDAGLRLGLRPEVVVFKRIHAANYMLSDVPASQHDLVRLLRESVARKRRLSSTG